MSFSSYFFSVRILWNVSSDKSEHLSPSFLLQLLFPVLVIALSKVWQLFSGWHLTWTHKLGSNCVGLCVDGIPIFLSTLPERWNHFKQCSEVKIDFYISKWKSLKRSKISLWVCCRLTKRMTLQDIIKEEEKSDNLFMTYFRTSKVPFATNSLLPFIEKSSKKANFSTPCNVIDLLLGVLNCKTFSLVICNIGEW